METPRALRRRTSCGRTIARSVGLLIVSMVLAGLDAPVRAQNADEHADEPSGLEFRTIHFEKKLADSSRPEGCCTFQTFEYPEFFTGAPEQALAIINQLIREYWPRKYDKGITIDSLANYALERYREYKRDDPDSGSPWGSTYSARIVLNAHGLLSLAFKYDGYQGGGHSNYYTDFINLDAQTGARLELHDVMSDGYEPLLDSIGEREFRSARKIPAEKTLLEAGFDFQDNQFRASPNFTIEPSGLVFWYNPYDIADWAAGPTKISVSYAEIRDLIRPNGPLAPLIPDH